MSPKLSLDAFANINIFLSNQNIAEVCYNMCYLHQSLLGYGHYENKFMRSLTSSYYCHCNYVISINN